MGKNYLILLFISIVMSALCGILVAYTISTDGHVGAFVGLLVGLPAGGILSQYLWRRSFLKRNVQAKHVALWCCCYFLSSLTVLWVIDVVGGNYWVLIPLIFIGVGNLLIAYLTRIFNLSGNE